MTGNERKRAVTIHVIVVNSSLADLIDLGDLSSERSVTSYGIKIVSCFWFFSATLLILTILTDRNQVNAEWNSKKC